MKQVHAVVWQENKWFIARALEVEVASQGRTQKTALKNLKEALQLYFEDPRSIDLPLVKRPTLERLNLSSHA